MTVINLLFSQRTSGTVVWVTISPQTNTVNSQSMTNFNRIVSVFKRHSGTFWAYDEMTQRKITLGKIDIAIDLEGSFLPCRRKLAFDSIKDKL